MLVRWLPIFLVILAGCSVGSTSPQIEVVEVGGDEVPAYVQTAFDALQDAAEAAGGAAVLLRPGTDATLKIDSGKLAGTEIFFPQFALPKGVAYAALLVQHAPVASPSEEFLVWGPGALIQLLEVPTGTVLELASPLAITLPAPEMDDPLDHPAVVAQFQLTGDVVPIGGNTVMDEFGGFESVIKATIMEQGTYAAVFQVTPSTFFSFGWMVYSVQKNSEVLCVGAAKLADLEIEHSIDHALDPSEISLSVLGATYLEYSATEVPNQVPSFPPSGFTADGTQSASFSCNGILYTPASDSSYISYGGWNSTLSSKAGSCSAACTVYKGMMQPEANVDFTTADGEQVRVRFYGDVKTTWAELD